MKPLEKLVALIAVVAPIWTMVYNQGQESQVLAEVAKDVDSLAIKFDSAAKEIVEQGKKDIEFDTRLSNIEREIFYEGNRYSYTKESRDNDSS